MTYNLKKALKCKPSGDANYPVNICVCRYMYLLTCTCIYMYIIICICTCMSMPAVEKHMYIHVHVYNCVWLFYAFVYVCTTDFGYTLAGKKTFSYTDW